MWRLSLEKCLRWKVFEDTPHTEANDVEYFRSRDVRATTNNGTTRECAEKNILEQLYL